MGAKTLCTRDLLVALALAVAGAQAQADPAVGHAAMLCTQSAQDLEIDIRFHDPRAVDVQLTDPSSGELIALFKNSTADQADAAPAPEPIHWRGPLRSACARLTARYRAEPGAVELQPAICLAGNGRIGFAETAQAPLLATVRFNGATLQAAEAACADYPAPRAALARPAPAPIPPPAASPGQVPAFPWPPPMPSTRRALPGHLVVGAAAQPTLGTVADRLQAALEQAGYVEYGYYRVPDGFAIATRLERIYPDGQSMPAPGRWQLAQAPLQGFELGEYVRALFDVEQGYFRVIVFVVTSAPLTTAPEAPTAHEALDWPMQGATALPAALRGVAYGDAFQTTALIYEFQSRGRGHEASFNQTSRLTGDAHLRQAHVLEGLQ